DKCIHQLFEEQVIKTPDAIAVELEGEKLTYQELNQQANQLANYLQKLGVNPEVLVGICVERSPLMLIGLLGILKAGGAYVPLDPSYPAERLAYMLDDSQAKVLLTQQQLVNSIPNTGLQVICLDTNWELISTQSDKNPQTQVKANNLAYVIYTSGSTGKPKGVMIEHRSLANFAQTVKDKYEISNRDRVLQAASISFDAAAEEIYPCLVSGATLVLRTAEMLGTVSTFIQKCWEWELTVLMMGTAYWHQLTAELATTNETLPPSVRLLANGGEQWLPEKLNLWQKSMEYRSRVQNLKAPPMLMNGYGPTEATVLSTVYNLSELRLENTQGQQIIGTPFDNVQTYILDSFLQPVPIGVPGELHIGGMGLARGYLHHPDLTDAKFIPHPFKPLERIYKTGDLARYLPDVNIEFLGRIDNQVKIRGFRIELGEIETLLITHPQISEAVVIDSDDIPGSKRLVAYIVETSSGTSLPQSQLRSFLKEKLPDYMIPSAFVVLDALPLTPNGKLDRRNLPKPDQNRPDSAANYVAPQTDVERTIATVWEKVLHLENIGIHDNFFEIGGHSLLATQIISRLRQILQMDLSVRTLFTAPTIASFAEYCETIQGKLPELQTRSLTPQLQAQIPEPKAEISVFLHKDDLSAIKPVGRTENLPLSFAQARLWFLDKLDPNSAFYNIPILWRFSGKLNVTALQSSLNEIIRRHEALRTNFVTQENQPIQVIAETLFLPLEIVDLLYLPTEEREVEMQRLVQNEAVRSYDLEREPLIRATLLQLTSTEYVFILTAHHII
ncbi:MAG: amino acid adenylation domain-containing protein, partial [Aphanizomenon sp.]